MVASAPNITGTASGFGVSTSVYCSGACKATNITTETIAGGTAQGKRIDFDASRSSNIYGTSNTIRPISRRTRFIIRF